ncbi:MAG: T9SS type A sorting domain-containing protein [Saprospiraceae bacterium]|nr:T9SS type A sorting domain-containing protein [Saprospiraceae bacterium]
MKHLLLLCLVLALSTPLTLSAQLPDGATAPDWTATDIFGNQHHLYDLLDEGKMVVIEFSATWCGPCWNYMLTGALEDFWNEHGPNGTDEAQVFYIEADQSTGIDDLYGNTGASQGNWVENIPFPIIDLQVGENIDNDYQITYYPTLYAVCSDRKIYELGQVPAAVWAEFIQSCALTGSLTDTEPATCFGDGTATVEASGGVSPINYQWSNGDSGPVLQGVGAGTYSATITEANGRNVVIDDIVITGADAPITLADSEVEPALCYASADGSVSISLQDGALPFDYDWSNGAHTQNLNNVAQGTYTVNATDNNGCTFEATFEVPAPDELVAEYATTPEYCDQEDGTVALDIDGGVGNYDISASEGTVVGNQVLDIPAGFVSVTIEDGNGCLWNETIEIEFVPEPNVYFNPDPTITCTQPQAAVTGYVNQGSGDYEYEWTTTNGNIVGPANQATIQVDQAGDYDLLVYDLFSGCQVASSIEVVSQVVTPAVTAGDDEPISCEALQPQLAGVGDPGFTVSWTSPDGNIVGGGNTYQPTVDAPGMYIIEVTNPDNSCSNQDTVVVLNEINPADAAYQYQTSSLTMIGTDMSTGSNLSGWTWTFGDGNTSNEPNIVHTFASAGTYEVCISVQNGCGVSQICQSVEVTSSGSVINVDAQIQNVLCNSDTTGSIVLQVNGGTGNYTYAWTGPNGATYSTPSIVAIIAGVYQVVVSDDQSNVFIGEYTVTEPALITLVGSTVIDNQCFGQSNGSLAVDITGGVSPFTYSFNGGPSQPENLISNLPGGIIECIATDANGCSFLAGPYTIQEPLELTHAAVVTDVRCHGESNGSASVVVNGGVAPYTYLWNLNGSTEPAISDVPAGSYTCAVVDHNGCNYNAIAIVAEPEVLSGITLQTVDATGPEQNNGSITIEAAGGVAPYTVAWSNGATGTTIEGLIPGTYSYIITDANGCSYAPGTPITISGIVATVDIDWSAFISLAPNPSKGDVIVKWEGLEIENGTVTLLTMEGKRLESRSIKGGQGQWDLSGLGLSSGIYVVLFEMDKQAVPFKLIVL